MNRFPLLSEFLDGVLDAFVEGVLLNILNLPDVILHGAEAELVDFEEEW